jgi:hypothetical protein
MPVESASHISGLDSDNPLTTDDVSQGDDHLRLIKSVLLADFANIDAAVLATPTQLDYTTVTTLGTGEASKALTADGSANVDLTPLTVTADTQSPADNSTKLATTAYVDAAGVGTATGSHTFASVATKTNTPAWDWAHGLGTDDVDFGFSMTTSNGLPQVISVNGTDVNEYTVWQTGGGVTGVSTGAGTAPADNLSFKGYNDWTNSITISIKVWARARA